MSAAESSTNIPPEASNAVFYCHIEREIDVPFGVVWDILTDLPRYSEWNASVPTMTIVDSAKHAAPEQRLTEHSIGSFLLMDVQAPSRVKAFEHVMDVNEKEFRLSWGTSDFPSWLLKTERRQVLTPTLQGNDEGAGGKTRYECWAFFEGPLAYVLKLTMRAKLQASFEATAEALKERAERSGLQE